MRETATAVRADRADLRLRVSILEEALTATTAGDIACRHERTCTDPDAGTVRMVASLIHPRRAHGGVVLVETHHSGRRDVDVILLEDWRERVRRACESGSSSAWVWAEDALIRTLDAEA